MKFLDTGIPTIDNFDFRVVLGNNTGTYQFDDTIKELVFVDLHSEFVDYVTRKESFAEITLVQIPSDVYIELKNFLILRTGKSVNIDQTNDEEIFGPNVPATGTDFFASVADIITFGEADFTKDNNEYEIRFSMTLLTDTEENINTGLISNYDMLFEVETPALAVDYFVGTASELIAIPSPVTNQTAHVSDSKRIYRFGTVAWSDVFGVPRLTPVVRNNPDTGLQGKISDPLTDPDFAKATYYWAAFNDMTFTADPDVTYVAGLVNNESVTLPGFNIQASNGPSIEKPEGFNFVVNNSDRFQLSTILYNFFGAKCRLFILDNTDASQTKVKIKEGFNRANTINYNNFKFDVVPPLLWEKSLQLPKKTAGEINSGLSNVDAESISKPLIQTYGRWQFAETQIVASSVDIIGFRTGQNYAKIIEYDGIGSPEQLRISLESLQNNLVFDAQQSEPLILPNLFVKIYKQGVAQDDLIKVVDVGNNFPNILGSFDFIELDTSVDLELVAGDIVQLLEINYTILIDDEIIAGLETNGTIELFTFDKQTQVYTKLPENTFVLSDSTDPLIASNRLIFNRDNDGVEFDGSGGFSIRSAFANITPQNAYDNNTMKTYGISTNNSDSNASIRNGITDLLADDFDFTIAPSITNILTGQDEETYTDPILFQTKVKNILGNQFYLLKLLDILSPDLMNSTTTSVRQMAGNISQYASSYSTVRPAPFTAPPNKLRAFGNTFVWVKLRGTGDDEPGDWTVDTKVPRSGSTPVNTFTSTEYFNAYSIVNGIIDTDIDVLDGQDMAIGMYYNINDSTVKGLRDKKNVRLLVAFELWLYNYDKTITDIKNSSFDKTLVQPADIKVVIQKVNSAGVKTVILSKDFAALTFDNGGGGLNGYIGRTIFCNLSKGYGGSSELYRNEGASGDGKLSIGGIAPATEDIYAGKDLFLLDDSLFETQTDGSYIFEDAVGIEIMFLNNSTIFPDIDDRGVERLSFKKPLLLGIGPIFKDNIPNSLIKITDIDHHRTLRMEFTDEINITQNPIYITLKGGRVDGAGDIIEHPQEMAEAIVDQIAIEGSTPKQVIFDPPLTAESSQWLMRLQLQEKKSIDTLLLDFCKSTFSSITFDEDNNFVFRSLDIEDFNVPSFAFDESSILKDSMSSIKYRKNDEIYKIFKFQTHVDVAVNAQQASNQLPNGFIKELQVNFDPDLVIDGDSGNVRVTGFESAPFPDLSFSPNQISYIAQLRSKSKARIEGLKEDFEISLTNFDSNIVKELVYQMLFLYDEDIPNVTDTSRLLINTFQPNVTISQVMEKVIKFFLFNSWEFTFKTNIKYFIRDATVDNSKNRLQLGDFVTVNTAFFTGGLDLNCLITRLKPDFYNGTVEVTCYSPVPLELTQFYYDRTWAGFGRIDTADYAWDNSKGHPVFKDSNVNGTFSDGGFGVINKSDYQFVDNTFGDADGEYDPDLIDPS